MRLRNWRSEKVFRRASERVGDPAEQSSTWHVLLFFDTGDRRRVGSAAASEFGTWDTAPQTHHIGGDVPQRFLVSHRRHASIVSDMLWQSTELMAGVL